MSEITNKEIKINTLGEFIEVSNKLDDWIYRGQRKASWQLIPKIGRYQINELRGDNDRLQKIERAIINEIRLRLPAHGYNIENRHSGNENKFYTEWNAIILGQHYGLPTRLLDFSKSPLVALYFACLKDCDENSAIWCFKLRQDLKYPQHKIYRTNPFTYRINDIKIIFPSFIDKRISAQSSVFMYFGLPFHHLKDNDYLKKIIIMKDSRNNILNQLDSMGINEETLFPDLSGVINYLKWRIEEKYLK